MIGPRRQGRAPSVRGFQESAKMKAMMAIVMLALCANPANAAVECAGKIYKVYKPSGATTLSVMLTMSDGTFTNWVSMPAKSEEAMALMAFAADKPVHFYWGTADVTTCANGWAQNRTLEGFFAVD